jgi:hypothetical protein
MTGFLCNPLVDDVNDDVKDDDGVFETGSDGKRAFGIIPESSSSVCHYCDYDY